MSRRVKKVDSSRVSLVSRGSAAADSGEGPLVATTDADEVARSLAGARNVLIVPGFGVALSRCPKELCEVARLLLCRTQAKIAVSPLAGRFAGHMSLYLEDVPQHFVITAREANASLFAFDAALVVGASDVVDPRTLHRVNQRAGMVVEVWRLPSVFWLKRRLPSPDEKATHGLLLQAPSVRVLAQDAKRSLGEIAQRLRALAAPIEALSSDTAAAALRSWPPLRVSSDSPAADSDASSFLQQAAPAANAPCSGVVGVLRDSLIPELLPLHPADVGRLRRLGLEVWVERLADAAALAQELPAEALRDEAFRAGGAQVAFKEQVLDTSDVLLYPEAPPVDVFDDEQRDWRGKTLVGNFSQTRNAAFVERAARAGATVLCLDTWNSEVSSLGVDLPSALATLRGYRAVMEALFFLPKIVKSLTTAAGKIEAAKVLVIGGGVAAMHAVAAGSRAGASVFLTDVGLGAKQLAESCGGAFLPALSDVPAWEHLDQRPDAREKLEKAVTLCDVVVCAPSSFEGAPPRLVSDALLRRMKRSAVVVDLAAGHPEAVAGWAGSVQRAPLGQGEAETVESVTVVNGARLERSMPEQATRMHSQCICNLLEVLADFPRLQLPELEATGPGGEGASPRRLTQAKVLRSLVIVFRGQVQTRPSWTAYRGRRTVSRASLLSANSCSEAEAENFFRRSPSPPLVLRGSGSRDEPPPPEAVSPFTAEQRYF